MKEKSYQCFVCDKSFKSKNKECPECGKDDFVIDIDKMFNEIFKSFIVIAVIIGFITFFLFIFK